MTRPALPARRRSRSITRRSLALATLTLCIVTGLVLAVQAALDDPDTWNQDRLASMNSVQVAAARNQTQRRMLIGAGVFLCGPLLVGAGAIVLTVRRRLRPSLGVCPKCRYNLRYNHSGVCPECGTPIAGIRRSSQYYRPTGSRSAGGGAMLPFYVVPQNPRRPDATAGPGSAQRSATPTRTAVNPVGR